MLEELCMLREISKRDAQQDWYHWKQLFHSMVYIHGVHLRTSYLFVKIKPQSTP